MEENTDENSRSWWFDTEILLNKALFGEEPFPPIAKTHPDVIISRSPLQGLGLFSTAEICKGEYITCFQGYLIHKNDLNSMTGDKKIYLAALRGSDYYIDSQSRVGPLSSGSLNLTSSGAGMLMNSLHTEYNCKLKRVSMNNFFKRIGHIRVKNELSNIMPPVIILESKRKINPGEELTWAYPCYDEETGAVIIEK